MQRQVGVLHFRLQLQRNPLRLQIATLEPDACQAQITTNSVNWPPTFDTEPV